MMIGGSSKPLETGIAIGADYQQGWAATLDALGHGSSRTRRSHVVLRADLDEPVLI